jgi:hypothetical protein
MYGAGSCCRFWKLKKSSIPRRRWATGSGWFILASGALIGVLGSVLGYCDCSCDVPAPPPTSSDAKKERRTKVATRTPSLVLELVALEIGKTDTDADL